MLGSGGMIVIPKSSDMVELIQVLMHFYYDESCGQCTPCREGTGWLHKIVKRLRGGEGTPEDLDLLEHVCDGMVGLTICPLADAAVMPMRSFLDKFRPEFEALIQETAPAGPHEPLAAGRAGVSRNGQADHRRQGDRGSRRNPPLRRLQPGAGRGAAALLLPPRPVASPASAACARSRSRACPS